MPSTSAEYPARLAALDYSETAFVRQFRQPASYNTPDGEAWRLYSRRVNTDGKDLELFVGYREKAPSMMVETPRSQIDAVDAELKRQAALIAPKHSDQMSVVRGSRGALSVDGFEVVDAKNKQVVEWGPWLPAFLPKEARPPSAGWRPMIFDNDLYLVRSDRDAVGRLLATSLVDVGSLWWVGGSCVAAFFAVTIVSGSFGRRFLRSYFAMAGTRVPTLNEAQQSGEGQRVEFKRGLSAEEVRPGSVEEEVLKSIAAFANTNDGVIYIGIDDIGHVKGLRLDFAGRDRFERKLRQLVRNRIRPAPSIQITFEEVCGLLVARIVIARGEAPAYMIGGVVYVRDGSSDIQAQPEDLIRLFSQYAF